MRAGVSRDADSELPAARTVALWGIFVLLLLAVLYAARSLALPVVFAALASLVLGPVVRALVRIRVPAPLAAAGLLLLLLGGTGYGLVALAGPATEWVKGAPEGAREIERKLRFLRDPVAKVSQATEQVERATRLPGAQPTQTVIVQPRRFSDVVLDQTQGFASGLFVSAVLLFFLLSSPDGFLEKAVELAPRLEDKKRVVVAAREIEGEVSTYLLTMSAINAVFGLAVWLAMLLLGVPNAELWGVVAGLTNFVPYVGGLATAVVLAGVGILTFDDPWRMFLPAGAFVLLNVVEANLVTPFLMARRLTLNPVVVFVWVMLWSWLWGVPGGLIAVPLLAVLKIVCQHIPNLAPLARLVD
jgi:predicted PurR-regulated permease PerM